MTALLVGVGVLALALLMVTVNLAWARQYDEAIKNAKALDAKGQQAAEAQLLQHYLDTNPPKQYQPGAAELLGDAEKKSGDNRLAFKWYFKADSLQAKPSLELKVKVADTAAGAGDKATAISYYKQALALTPKSDSEHTGIYQDQIRSLGGNP